MNIRRRPGHDRECNPTVKLGQKYQHDGGIDELLLHHLSREQKRRTLIELHRVLRSGGWLDIADWGEPRSIRQRIGDARSEHSVLWSPKSAPFNYLSTRRLLVTEKTPETELAWIPAIFLSPSVATTPSSVT